MEKKLETIFKEIDKTILRDPCIDGHARISLSMYDYIKKKYLK